MLLRSEDINALKIFEDSSSLIRKEFFDFYSHHSNLFTETSFKRLNPAGSGKSFTVFDKDGEFYYPENFPNLLQCINLSKSSVIKVYRAFFAIALPESRLPIHNDIDDSLIYLEGGEYRRMRAHLGIEIPSGCNFYLYGTKVSWDLDKVFAFDQQDLHWAYNNNKSEQRVVLIIDFLYPDSHLKKTVESCTN